MTRRNRAQLKRAQEKRDAWNAEARKRVPPVPGYTAREKYAWTARREMDAYDRLPPDHRDFLKRIPERIIQ